jgi:hypothetical protein
MCFYSGRGVMLKSLFWGVVMHHEFYQKWYDENRTTTAAFEPFETSYKVLIYIEYDRGLRSLLSIFVVIG